MARLLFTFLAFSLCWLAPSVRAQDEPTSEQAAKFREMKGLADGLQYREGKFKLSGDVATIETRNGFRFLNQTDAGTVLSKLWHNPPNSQILGMLMPEGVTPLSQEAWAVVITFDKDGHVKDGDAAKLDYQKLLQQMQEETRAANPEREKEGYPAIELIGWATKPHYDASTHQLYWAKELQIGGGEETLNYCIRALGREGVLQLNAVASMNQLPEVERATPAILKMIDFQQGHRYVDFNPATDKVAKYGIAALIAGGILAKTGLLKGLLVALLAAKKFVLVGAVALIASIKRLFARFSGRDQSGPGA